MAAKPRIVVVGGGFGGLEAAFYLRYKLGDRADMTLVTDRPYFLFKPNTIYIPFGADPERYKIDLKRPTERKQIRLVEARIDEIIPERRTIAGQKQKIDYDYLVVATGAAMRPQEIPGLTDHALTLWTPEEMLALGKALQTVLEKARDRQRQRILFLVPPNNKCSGPLYELVLMADTWLREQSCREAVDLVWATKEESYIQAFGPRLNTVIEAEFDERRIEGYRGFVVTSVEPNQVTFQNGERLRFDLLVSFPPYVAGNRYPTLPSDDRGFIQVLPDSRRVRGCDNIFSVGDAADFPIKQAFLALLQGDAAADHLAAAVLGKEAKVDFEPMSMCVMEELNKATFAQVPLKYTGDLKNPVEVDAADAEHYKVGVSPVWRLGKKVLGTYLPWRFGHGEPFHAGLAWDTMDLGLKVMARVLAK
jgi:sulfide:quinone oxidoreductase